jgi:hypothetical protein
MVNISGYSEKTKHKIEYKNLDSARRPIPHDDEMPVPTPPKDKIVSINDETVCEEAISEGESASGDPQYTPDITETDLEPFSQEELNDLIRNLSLSKEKAELLSSRLQQKNLLQDYVKITHYRSRNHALASFFAVDGPLCYCTEIDGLFTCLSQTYLPSEWHLFIDSSQICLKAVLLHNGNKKPSIHIAHAVHLNETYENMVVLLDAINYKIHKWSLCGDLKVI